MKIGVDIRTLMDKYYSGVSSYTFNLLSELLETDENNQYFLYYNSAKKVHIPKLPNAPKIITSRYPNKLFNYFLQRILTYPKLDQVLGGVDIFWSPHVNFLSLSKASKKVITVHDLSFLRYPEFFSKRKNFWHQALKIKKLLLKMDKVIAVSENTKRDLMELLDIAEDKIAVVYSGLDRQFRQELSEETKLAVKQKYNLPDKFILSLSTLEPRKNISGLISAYDILLTEHPEFKDLRLVLAGPKGWKYKDIFFNIQSSKFKDNIILTDYIEQADKPALYGLAHIFVYPSFYEGFGFPPLEAMASGVPVITSFTSSLPEIVGMAAWLVDPAQPLEIAQGIYNLSKDQELYDRFSKLGLEQSQKFNWSKTAAQYLEIFRNLNYEK